ncbi:MAG: hypothetical protein WBP42_13340 [Candidatus Zixiibacteriota bacterium]
MRTLVPFLAVFAIFAVLFGCSDPVDPEDPIFIIDGPAYFPVNDGDTWYYTRLSDNAMLTRHIDGDTTVNGYSCKRLFLGPEVDEAWSITSARFAQHIVGECWWFDPPLDIPLDLEKGKAHSFSSLGRVLESCESDADSMRSMGTLVFDGYVSKEISGVMVDSCLKIHYDYVTTIYYKDGRSQNIPEAYSEIWGKGIGLLDNESIVLLSAVINGVELPKR